MRNLLGHSITTDQFRLLYYSKLKKYLLFRWFVKLFRHKILKLHYQIRSIGKHNDRKYICIHPWSHAAIKSHGGVTCATASRRQKELFFGNINTSSFISIWHGARFQAIRKKIAYSRTKLPYLCYTCPYKIEYNDISSLTLKPDYPKELWLETTDMCNLKCPLCLHHKERRGHFLSIKAFTKLIDEIGPHLQTLHFFLDGENFLHPEATNMTRYIKKVNPGITIDTSTNGLLFNSPEKQESFVKSGIDDAIFSIDGATQESYTKYRKGGKLDIVLSNMKAIIDLRNQLNIPLLIKWRYILFEWNDSDEEMDLARKLASDIGVDSLIWLITTSAYHSKRFFISHINDYSVKLPNESFKGTFTGVKENLFNQKLT